MTYLTYLMKNRGDLFNEFYNNQSIAIYVVELLFQVYKDYQLGYDIRKTIDDEECQKIMKDYGDILINLEELLCTIEDMVII